MNLQRGRDAVSELSREFLVQPRGTIQVKGKGAMVTFLLHSAISPA